MYSLSTKSLRKPKLRIVVEAFRDASIVLCGLGAPGYIEAISYARAGASRGILETEFYTANALAILATAVSLFAFCKRIYVEAEKNYLHDLLGGQARCPNHAFKAQNKSSHIPSL